MNDPKLKEDAVYIVKDGKLEPIDKPLTGFGTTSITWQNGKFVSYEVRYTKR